MARGHGLTAGGVARGRLSTGGVARGRLSAGGVARGRLSAGGVAQGFFQKNIQFFLKSNLESKFWKML